MLVGAYIKNYPYVVFNDGKGFEWDNFICVYPMGGGSALSKLQFEEDYEYINKVDGVSTFVSKKLRACNSSIANYFLFSTFDDEGTTRRNNALYINGHFTENVNQIQLKSISSKLKLKKWIKFAENVIIDEIKTSGSLRIDVPHPRNVRKVLAKYFFHLMDLSKRDDKINLYHGTPGEGGLTVVKCDSKEGMPLFHDIDFRAPRTVFFFNVILEGYNHAFAVIVDTTGSQPEYITYDPNGMSLTPPRAKDCIHSFITTYFKNAKNITPEVCPRFGPQSFDKNQGFCMLWALWMVELIIKNSNVPMKDLVKDIAELVMTPHGRGNESFTSFIRNYATFVYSTVAGMQ